MTSAKRRKARQNWLNKARWPIIEKELQDPCPHIDIIVPKMSQQDLEDFREEVNRTISSNMKLIAPTHLQFGGQGIALIIMILGAVAITQDSPVVGAVLFLLGFFLVGLAFWYRDQLITRSWKKIGQSLHKYFQECSMKFPGVSYEFHVQGHHTRERENKRKHKKEQERSTVWYERYIVIYLPGDQNQYHEYVQDQRTVAEIIQSDSKAMNVRKTVIDGKAVTLPYWWATAKDKRGKTYYINNLKHRTQWNPPTQEQIEMETGELNEILAPPGAKIVDESSSEESSDEE